VRVFVHETPVEGRYTIRDEGPGFDKSLLATDPRTAENVAKSSGRGLFLIHTFMDEVAFNDKGNEITMIHRYCPSDGDVDWQLDDDGEPCGTASFPEGSPNAGLETT
jgi:hypothetical protein